jgi:RNA-directed DNA polymerase
MSPQGPNLSELGEGSMARRRLTEAANLSPLLANIYLHYASDLWVDVWRQKWAQGEVIVIRYADDIILGFQHRAEADRFLENFRERLGRFGLELQRIRRAGLSSGGLPNKTGNEEGKASPRRSIS